MRLSYGILVIAALCIAGITISIPDSDSPKSTEIVTSAEQDKLDFYK